MGWGGGVGVRIDPSLWVDTPSIALSVIITEAPSYSVCHLEPPRSDYVQMTSTASALRQGYDIIEQGCRDGKRLSLQPLGESWRYGPH